MWRTPCFMPGAQRCLSCSMRIDSKARRLRGVEIVCFSWSFGLWCPLFIYTCVFMALLFEAVFRRGPPTAPVWGLGLIGLRESVSAVDKDVGREARFERKVGMEQAPRSLVSVLLQKNLDAAQTFRMSSQHIPQINQAQEFVQQKPKRPGNDAVSRRC